MAVRAQYASVQNWAPRPRSVVSLMNTQKLVGFALLVAGGLGLIYGGFSYTRETHQANVGSLHMSIDETRHVSIPVWAGIGSLVAGGLMLALGRKN